MTAPFVNVPELISRSFIIILSSFINRLSGYIVALCEAWREAENPSGNGLIL